MRNNQPPPLVPQLILTVAEGQAHLESSDALPVTSPHPAGDTEAVLAAVSPRRMALPQLMITKQENGTFAVAFGGHRFGMLPEHTTYRTPEGLLELLRAWVATPLGREG